ncbi:hypothetical protein SFA33_22905 [Escherichia coli]|nr:hypothetical protein [Escherichia coli]
MMEKVLAQSSSRLMSMPFFGVKTRSVTGFSGFAITYNNGKISDLHEIYAFLSTFAILCYENAAFCFERVPSTNNKASLSSR